MPRERVDLSRYPSTVYSVVDQEKRGELERIFQVVTDWADDTVAANGVSYGTQMRVNLCRTGNYGLENLASALIFRENDSVRPINRFRVPNRHGSISPNRGIAFVEFSLPAFSDHIVGKVQTNRNWPNPAELPSEDLVEQTLFFNTYRLFNAKGVFLALEKQDAEGTWSEVAGGVDLSGLMEESKKDRVPMPEELERIITGLQNFGKRVAEDAYAKQHIFRPAIHCWLKARRVEGRNLWREINVRVPLEGYPFDYPLSYADTSLYHNDNVSQMQYGVEAGTIINRKRSRTQKTAYPCDLDEKTLETMWWLLKKKAVYIQVMVRVSAADREGSGLSRELYPDPEDQILTLRELGEKYAPDASANPNPPNSSTTIYMFPPRSRPGLENI